MEKRWDIGDTVVDEDGCTGIVCIRYIDGDICTIENDAAHPSPLWMPGKSVKFTELRKLKLMRRPCRFCGGANEMNFNFCGMCGRDLCAA